MVKWGTGHDGGSANPGSGVWFSWTYIWVGNTTTNGTLHYVDRPGNEAQFTVQAGQKVWFYIHDWNSQLGDKSGRDNLGGVTLELWRLNPVVGSGAPESCTEAALDAALNLGGQITFNCGAEPHTITLTSNKFITKDTSLNGGGLITLSGGSALITFNVDRGIGPSIKFDLQNLALRNMSIWSFDAAIIHVTNSTWVNTAGQCLFSRATSFYLDHTSVSGCGFINDKSAGLFITDSVVANSPDTAVWNYAGTVVVLRSTFTGNHAAASGGAIWNEAILQITDSIFRDNTANTIGGAIYNRSQVTINRSLFAANRATALEGAYGGAIYNDDGAITIAASTFSGNQARSAGGALFNSSGSTDVNSSTFYQNYALFGGGLYRKDGEVKATNTILANNAGGNCYGAVSSQGYNLVNDTSCNFTRWTDRQNTDPLLGSLADNGGPTQTHALLPRSPAIDKGFCAGPVDQRGSPRPFDIPGVPNASRGNGCDIGSFEIQNMMTVTAQVVSRSDDVNEILSPSYSVVFQPNLATVWIGNDGPNMRAFTGLRFANLQIPPDAVINSAYLEVYTPADNWISVAVSIAAHATDNSTTFNFNTRPSRRLLTTNQASYRSNRQWRAGTWGSLGEFPLVIQEVIDRPGWQNGNGLSLILQGTGMPWGRIFVTSNNGNPQFAPKLVITYVTGGS
jgi:hypothetical protein